MELELSEPGVTGLAVVASGIVTGAVVGSEPGPKPSVVSMVAISAGLLGRRLSFVDGSVGYP